MSITPITTDQLRRIADYDGLILQGCGGSLQEWQDTLDTGIKVVHVAMQDHSLHDGQSFLFDII